MTTIEFNYMYPLSTEFNVIMNWFTSNNIEFRNIEFYGNFVKVDIPEEDALACKLKFGIIW